MPMTQRESRMSTVGRIRHTMLLSIAAATIFLMMTISARAADVAIAWDPNTETDLAGYKVYVGTASGVYGTPIIIGKQTTYTITGLSAGTTYYIAVTAFNSAGLESGYSNEVSTTIPGTQPSTSKCDIDSNGAVNALDLQIMINVIMGTRTMPSGRGDLNGDAKYDALDLQVLVNVILGTRSCPL